MLSDIDERDAPLDLVERAQAGSRAYRLVKHLAIDHHNVAKYAG
jgi:hypothetical protein